MRKQVDGMACWIRNEINKQILELHPSLDMQNHICLLELA